MLVLYPVAVKILAPDVLNHERIQEPAFAIRGCKNFGGVVGDIVDGGAVLVDERRSDEVFHARERRHNIDLCLENAPSVICFRGGGLTRERYISPVEQKTQRTWMTSRTRAWRRRRRFFG